MEKNNKESCENCCDNCGSCGSCGGYHHGFHKYAILRWVLGIVILIMVFWLGFTVGEFKGHVEDGFGDYRYHRGMMYNNGLYPNKMMWAVPATGSSVGATDNSATVTP